MKLSGTITLNADDSKKLQTFIECSAGTMSDALFFELYDLVCNGSAAEEDSLGIS